MGERTVAERLGYVAKEVGLVVVALCIVGVLIAALVSGYLWIRGMIPPTTREWIFAAALIGAVVVCAVCLIYLIVAPICWWLADAWKRSADD